MLCTKAQAWVPNCDQDDGDVNDLDDDEEDDVVDKGNIIDGFREAIL